MIKNRIIITLILSSIIFGQTVSEKPKKPFMNTNDISFLGTSNRITSILDEAKQFLSDAIIAKKGNLESRTYFPIVRNDEGSNVLGEYKSLKEAVLKMETEICMEVEFGIWSDFAEEGLKEVA